ncbi:hypothetical protein D6833_07295, partial [Candidatus Parcubacteria bacterium]
ITFSEEEIEEILRRSRLEDGTYHPCKIQVFSAHVYKAHVSGNAGHLDKVWEEAEEEIDVLLSPSHRGAVVPQSRLPEHKPPSIAQAASLLTRVSIFLAGVAFLFTVGLDTRFILLVVIFAVVALMGGFIWLMSPE